jgi:hypothetical protein
MGRLGGRIRRWEWWLVAGAVVAGAALPGLLAAPQTFWPLYQWPPPTWHIGTTDDNPVVFGVPSVGLIFLRHTQVANLLNPTTPPPLNSAAAYAWDHAECTYELSLDGSTWFPVQGSGPIVVNIDHTSDSAGGRVFSTELLQLSITSFSPLGPVFIRESPTRPSLGQAIITSTNGGFLIGSFFDVFLEMSLDGGNTWAPTIATTHLELAGLPGVPADLSIAPQDAGSVRVSWTTQTNVHYQLQWTAFLEGGGWSNLGATLAGTVSNLCVTDAVPADVGKFFRVGLSP